MDSSRPVVGFDTSQPGEVSIGTAAGSVTNHGLDPARLATILERMLDTQYQINLRMSVLERTYGDNKLADAQERYTRQLAADERHDAEQRILVDAFDGVRDQIAEVGVTTRRWLIGLTLALVVIGAIVVAVVVDRLGVMALALLTATVAARLGR